jgi:hypothetical protein
VTWATYVSGVASILQGRNRAWHINPWGGNDMEVGWAPYNTGSLPTGYQRTKAFIDGYGAQMNGTPGISQERLVDFGDAWYNQQDWTDAAIYYKAIGATWDWPLPEIYIQAGADRWTSIRVTQGIFSYMGVMVTCRDAYPLGTSCSNPAGWFTPSQGWNALWNDLINNGVGQSSLDYATNIKSQ